MTRRTQKHRFAPQQLQTCEERCVPAWVSIPADAIAVAPTDGGIPQVSIVDPSTGKDVDTFMAYEAAFRGGVHVAVGDVNDDGVNDVVLAPGSGGGPRIRILDGKTGVTINDFFAYESTFTGGVTVAVGDVNGDGVGDIVTGTGNGGGPRVRVLDGTTAGATVLKDYFAYEDSFRGGVPVAAGDVDHDGKYDVITGTGNGGGPRVQVFSGADDKSIDNFFAFEDSFRGGVTVAAGDVNGDGLDDVICGTGVGGGPAVKVVDGKSGATLSAFLADDARFRGGVQVGAVDTDHDGREEIVAHVRHGNDVNTRTFDGHGEFELSETRRVDDDPSPHDQPPGGTVTPGMPGKVEGTIAAVDVAAGTVTLLLAEGSDFTGPVAAGAELERNDAHVTLDAFQVADRVELLVGPDGTIWEMETRAGHQGPGDGGSGNDGATSTEVEGTVTAVDTTSGTVSIRKQNGTTVVVHTGTGTKIERNDIHVTLDAIAVGDFGEATIEADGIATKVETVGP